MFMSSVHEAGGACPNILEGFGQHLQRHVPVELGVRGAIHFAHAAFADLGGDRVGAEGGVEVAICFAIGNAPSTGIGPSAKKRVYFVRLTAPLTGLVCYCFDTCYSARSRARAPARMFVNP